MAKAQSEKLGRVAKELACRFSHRVEALATAAALHREDINLKAKRDFAWLHNRICGALAKPGCTLEKVVLIIDYCVTILLYTSYEIPAVFCKCRS
jgi:hypothetical protein